MDPWQHYYRYGRAEGRLPRRNRALAWDHCLWRGAESVMVPRLQGLVEGADAMPEEQVFARWALARWFAWQGQWPAVVELLITPDISRLLYTAPSEVGAGPLLLALEALCRLAQHRQGDEAALRQVLAELQQRFPGQADTYLAQANAQAVHGDASGRLKAFNTLFAQLRLREVALRDACKPLGLDNLTTAPPHLASAQHPGASHRTRSARLPLVSVIVPLYNAQGSIATALRSLFEQTWRPLEIIVVDDASSDAGAEVVERLMGSALKALA